MSEKGKIKNLKSKLDGSRLDLSLSELTLVPSAKEILNLKKVSEIDLSRNRLQTLNDDFCLIINLTWLDLSSNGLKSLPEHFGKLATLQHLDLFQNQLQELPLSFCQLKHLRWLDLKDNPLKEPFRAAAGECLEPKDCKMAATKVVQYVQRLQSDHERERQKRLKIERDAEATRRAVEEDERKHVQQEKKKQKENKKKNTVQQPNSKRTEDTTRRDSTSDASEPDVQSKQRPKRSQRARNAGGQRGCAWKLCRLFFGTLAFLTFAIIASSTFLYFNCTGQKEILPKSRPLCHDIYMYLSTGQKSLTWDYAATGAELRTMANNAATQVVHSVKNLDFESWKSSFLEWNRVARENIVHFVKYCYTHGGEYAKYCYTHGGEYAAIFFEYVKIWSAVAWDGFLQVARHAVDLTARVARWIGDFLSDLSENYPAYWEKVKFYWKNTK